MTGDDVAVPSDALGALRPLLQAPMLCSRERPYGIHADLGVANCPRCGWAPKRRSAARSPDRPLSFC